MRLPPLVGGTRSESYAICAIAGALLLAGPLWLFLYDGRYPVRPEYFLLVGGAAVAGALGLAAAHRFGGLVETACFAVLAFLFIDMQFAPEAHVRAPVLFVVMFALALLLQSRRAAITAITLGAFYVSSLPRAGRGPEPRAHGSASVTQAGGPMLPVLLHVILDEQWGVGGLRAEGDTATASFLTDFYVDRGFELHPAAYSHWGRTVESITDMLSLGRAESLEPGRATRRARRRPSIPYFELLRSRGYAIHVFQSEYVDYCSAPGAPVDSCDTQPGNAPANIGHLDGPVSARAMLLGRYFLNITSRAYRAIHPDAVVWRRAGAGGALRTMEHLRAAIASGPRSGVVYFAHVMLPHRPHEVDAQCRAHPDPRKRIGDEPTPPLSDSMWAVTLATADQQIRCAHLLLGGVLDALDHTAGRDRSIVLVHGDHGGRLFQVMPPGLGVGPIDDRQLNSRFSTLLAVRRPGTAGGIQAEPVPTQDFIWRLVQQDFIGPVPGGYEHYVKASGWDSVPHDSLRLLTASAMPWAR